MFSIKSVIRQELEQLGLLNQFLRGSLFLDRVVYIWFLLGPFILLVERSPGDLWLSLCGLTFLIRCAALNYWTWLSVTWVKFVFVFWATCLVASAFSSIPVQSLMEAVSWFRFPLFAFALAFWLAKDDIVRRGMFASIFFSMLLMTLILFAEFFLVGTVAGRLSWPFGDMVSGNYLAKVSLPVFCVLSALAFARTGRHSFLCGLVLFFTTIASVFSGERINLVIRVFSGLVSALFYRVSILKLIVVFSVMLGSVPIFFHAFPDVEARFVARTVADLSDVTKSPHFRVVRGGVEAGLHSPILGIGTANYRELCEDFNGNNELVDCNNHPHNFYVQVFAEVGILGLVTMIAMVGSIFATTLQARYATNPRIFDRIAFVIPLAIFMPLQFTSDFFGQWNNLFMWTPLGLALASGTSVLMAKNSQKKSN